MNDDFAALPPSVVARLTELYCDFATHLISVPGIRDLPGAVQWLAERVLVGLPDAQACYERPFTTPNIDHAKVYNASRQIYLCFSYPDTDTNPGSMFTRGMQKANDVLHRLKLPVYPRVAEVDALHYELTELEAESHD